MPPDPILTPQRLAAAHDAYQRMATIAHAAAGRPLTRAQAADFDAAARSFGTDLAGIARPPLEALKAFVDIGTGGDPEAAVAAAKCALDTSTDRVLGPDTGVVSHASPGGSPIWAGGSDPARLAAGKGLALIPSERLADHLVTDGAGAGLTMNRWIKALVTGDWRDVEPAVKAMAAGSGPAGGYLVPEQLSARVIDKARNAARVIQAGALTVPMDSSTMKIARVGTDPSAAWKAENDPIAASDMILEQVVLTAHTLVALVKGSVELFEDAIDVQQTIENALAAVLALELDRAALRGSGTAPEPRGVLNTSGVTIQSTTGALDYAKIAAGITPIAVANGQATAYIVSPAGAGALDGLADTTGQPLRPPPSVEAITGLVTNQVPSAEAYIGQWDELLIGMRTNLNIEVSREAGSTTDSAFTNLQVWVRAYLRADVAVAQPGHFTVKTGITP